jgi:hypothetical protein
VKPIIRWIEKFVSRINMPWDALIIMLTGRMLMTSMKLVKARNASILTPAGRM